MALIRLRGHQQMQSQLGLQLLNQATASVAISSHRSKSEVPNELVSSVAHGLLYANNDDRSWGFRLISMRTANLRAAIDKGSLYDPDMIIAAAMELDHGFVAWSRTLPPSWQYEVHFVEQVDSTLVYEACYHLYPAYDMAQGLNAWRVSRMVLHEIIWDKVLGNNSSPLRSQDRATLISQVGATITRLMLRDLCLCSTIRRPPDCAPLVSIRVPNAVSGPRHLLYASLHMAKSSGSGFTHTARSYGIIWPLMAVASCVVPNSSRRAWVTNRLQFISSHMKNPQARLALEVLDAGNR